MKEAPDLLKGLSREERALLFERLRQKKEAEAAQRQAAAAEARHRRAPGQAMPLSFAQQRLWFLDRLAPGSPAYNIPLNVRLLGELDAGVLRRAFAEIVRRHESVRTRFEIRDGAPVQIVDPDPRLALVLIDLAALEPVRQQEELERVARGEARTAFDLARGPLLRIRLLRLAEREHVALLNMHHIASDGWSMGVVINELRALYMAFAAGRPSPLPELPLQYADFAEAQLERLSGARLAAEVEHWRVRLAGARPVELPLDRPRPAVPSFSGTRHMFKLSAALSERVQALARQERATLFTTLLAAFQALLSRHAGSDDIVVGTTTANRPEENLERLIGFFINTLLLRADLSGNPTFLGLLAQVRGTTLAAFSHQEVPFEKLVDELGLPRDPHRPPLLRVMLQLHNAPVSELELPGLRLEPFPLLNETSKFDLILNFVEAQSGLHGELRYDTDLFDAPTMIRLEGHLETLLGGIVEDPARPLSDLPLLTAPERHQLLGEWNAADGTFGNGLLHERFAAQAARTPGAIAVTAGEERLTYAELADRAGRLARRLRALGVGPESIVALCLERSADLVVAVLGVLEAGGAYLPLDPAYPPERLAFALEDSRAPVLVTREALLGHLPETAARLALLDVPDTAEGEGGGALSRKAGEGRGGGPDSLAYVIYTSGSTGRPKGVQVTHANAVRLFDATAPRFGFGPSDVWTLFHSYAFDFSVWEIWGALLYGGRLVVVPYWVSRSPEAFYRLLAAEQVTSLSQTPSAFRQLLWAEDAVRAGAEAVPPLALRWVVFGGEALDHPALAPWIARHDVERPALVNMYGITETTVHVTWRQVEAADATRRTVGSPVGRAIPDLTIRLLDLLQRPVPIGVAGEIHVGGAGVARGYLDRPGLTAERFVPDPWGEPGERLYRSGDLGRYRPDGGLEHLGRLDHQVKVRGFRIELGEIEAALAAHPAIRQAAVGVRSGPSGDNTLVAYVAAEPGAAPSLADLRAFLGESLPDYMLPAALVALDALPLTPSGKVDRRALTGLAETHAAAARPERIAEPPETPIEKALAALFAEVLKLEGEPGLHDDFFALGGSSISGAILINRLQEEIGEIVHVVVIFDHPTVASLAAYLIEQHPAAVERVWGRPAGAPAARREERPVTEEDVRTLVRRIDEARPADPAPAEAGKNPPAVFVLSPPRSGSTLLRVMLGAHPRLFAPPELELLSFRTLAERRAAFPGRDSFWLEGVTRAVMEARGCDGPEAERIVAAFEAEGWTTRRFYRELQGWLGEGRLLVDKTPSYALDPEILARAEAGFEGAFYLHLERHPLDVIRSFEEAKLDQIFFRRPHPFTRRQLAELIWIASHRNIQAFLAGIPAGRQRVVQFEDLVREPEAVMREVCAFLGIDYRPEMAEPYRPGVARMTDGVHAESRMLGDVKFHTHGTVDAAAADRWRQAEGGLPLGEPARALARELGYPVPETASAAEIDRSTAPLSFAQERLWFLDRLSPGTAAYNIPGALRLRGELDLAALGRVLDEIVRRHAALRTTFATATDGQPVQRIAPPAHRDLPIVDLGALPEPLREAELTRRVAEDAALPFGLETGPLLRVTLMRMAPADHAALFTMHHIVSDGWSMGVFFREVSELYAAFVRGLPSPLPEPALQYADFARRQRAELGEAALEQDLAYWRRALAGVPVLELPADRPRPPVKGARGALARFAIPAGPSEALLAAGRAERATSYMTLLAAFQALLARLADQTDVAVGSAVANRHRRDIEGLIGFFVNTVVVRTDLGGDPTFRELLGRVRRGVLGAFAHQDAPFEKVVEAVQPERHLAYTPLFQVMLTLQNAPPAEAVELPGLTLEPLPLAAAASKFDMTLAAFEHPAGIAGTLEHDLDLFEPETANRFLRQLAMLVEGAGEDPERRLSDLPLLTAAERRQLLIDANQAGVSDAPLRFLWETLADRAAATPDAPALESPEETITWRELDERSTRLARRLVRQGSAPEERVGLAFERSPGWAVALLGIWKAGAAALPLDPAYPEERRAHALADSGARLLLTDADLQAAEPQGPSPLGGGGWDRGEDRRGAASFLDSLAYVLYTSGTTGGPKGVAVTHRGLDNLGRAQAAAFGFTPADRLLQFASPAFDASISELAMTIHAGATLVFAPREDLMPGAPLAAVLRERRITGATLPPCSLANLDDPAAFPDLAGLVVAGEACPPALAEAWSRGRRFYNAYGPTETTVCATIGQPLPGSRFLPLGDPIAHARLYLLDRGLQLVPVGIPGEVCVAGEGLARGYLNRPDLTAERFVPDPFADLPGRRLYRTGDRARRLADGAVEFLGRVDRQVKVRGVRVEPGEVEAALAAHPAVREAAVVLRQGPSGEAYLAAYVALSSETTPAVLRAHLVERLPETYVPSRFVILPALPLSPNGKVDYRALPDPALAGSATAPTAPRTPVEEVLAGIWAEVLGLPEGSPPIGAGQSFFDLGGHSLSATRLMSRVQAAFGVDLPLRVLFEGPTVAELAERVSLALSEGSQTGTAPPPLVPAPRGGEELPLSFGQERLWFLDRLEPGTTSLNIRTALRLRGPLDVAALAGALAEVVRRHEALRTTFRWTGDRPVQGVAPPAPVPFPVIDLAGLPEDLRGPETERLAAEELDAPFDLARGPLLRARLIRLEPELHAFLLTVHHIVSDGWSMGVLTREVTALYAAYSAGLPSPLPELPVQYPDFAVWQRAWLQGDALEAQLAYWRQTLGGHPEPLDLPLDRPRPAVQTYRGESLLLRLPATLGRRLRALSRREGASLFMTLLAGFQLLLARLSGQTDILVGTPIAGRRQVETEGLVGFFLNTLVLRTDLSGGPSFRELLARVRETTLGAYAHQDIPFEALLAELQPERDLSRTPFFQVFFNMLNFPAEPVRSSELTIEPMGTPEAPSKFDLTVYLAEAGEEIGGNLVYNADLFDRVRMEELLAQYERLLEQAAEAPEAPVAAFSLRTPRAAEVLPDPTAPLGDEWRGSVHELFRERARRHPGKAAVTDDEGTWTYGELDRAADRLAARLQAAGVEKGDRVAVYAHRSAPVAWAVMGTLKAGAAFVMLDPAYPPARLIEMVRLAGPRAWIEIAAAGNPPSELEETLAALAAEGTLLARVALPGGGPAGAEAVLSGFPEESPERIEVGPDDVALLAFTSGSTGTPKGIEGRHGPLSHFLPWQSERFGLGESDRYSLLSGLAHDPLQRDLFTPLCLGGTICVPSFEEIATPGRLARWMARQGVTVAHLTPALGQILTETGPGEPPSIPSLRYVLLVGDVLTRLDVDRIRALAPHVTCVNLYGSTETQRAVGFHVAEPAGEGAEESRARQILPLGQGMRDVQILVVTGDAAEPALAGIGEVGEIWMRSPHLAKGYLGDEALTRDRFRVNPFTGVPGDRVYRTGDLGRYQPDGEAVFVGRADQQVKIRGFRIELGEIEAALGRLPGVREAVVIAVAGSDLAGKRLIAYVVPSGPAPDGFAAGLRDALRAKLPAYMVPAGFVLLDRLPVTPNAKVDRRALARMAPGPDGLDAALEGTFVEPEGDLEGQIAAVWREVLGLERVGVRHNFFDLGGHSLLLVRLHARLQETLGRELSLVDLFNYPSIRALAEHLGQSAAQAAAPAVVEVAQDRAQKQIEAARRQKELARARRPSR